jgi:hypothetical protein
VSISLLNPTHVPSTFSMSSLDPNNHCFFLSSLPYHPLFLVIYPVLLFLTFVFILLSIVSSSPLYPAIHSFDFFFSSYYPRFLPLLFIQVRYPLFLPLLFILLTTVSTSPLLPTIHCFYLSSSSYYSLFLPLLFILLSTVSTSPPHPTIYCFYLSSSSHYPPFRPLLFIRSYYPLILHLFFILLSTSCTSRLSSNPARLYPTIPNFSLLYFGNDLPPPPPPPIPTRPHILWHNSALV